MFDNDNDSYCTCCALCMCQGKFLKLVQSSRSNCSHPAVIDTAWLREIILFIQNSTAQSCRDVMIKRSRVEQVSDNNERSLYYNGHVGLFIMSTQVYLYFSRLASLSPWGVVTSISHDNRCFYAWTFWLLSSKEPPADLTPPGVSDPSLYQLMHHSPTNILSLFESTDVHKQETCCPPSFYFYTSPSL